jgi:hypothetical protein
MEKIINQPQRARLFLPAIATAVVVGVSSALSIPVQNVNAQSLSEFALLIQSQCEGQVEVKDDKVECGALEAKNDKLELPGCEIKEDKRECP